MSADVLYITFDGVTQPLPFSQVVRVVAGLAAHGLRYRLLSVERPADLIARDASTAVTQLLAPGSVQWTHTEAASMSSPKLAFQALAKVLANASAIIRRHRIRLVHARGYQAALAAYLLKRSHGVPYLFDTRGCWIEERAGGNGWFSGPGSYAFGKLLEQRLFRAASAIVTLTELQASDVTSIGRLRHVPVQIIPTCADYSEFTLRNDRPAKPATSAIVPDMVQRRLTGRTVVGLIGAFNGTYFIRESLEIVRRAALLDRRVHLLVLSAQAAAYGAAIRDAGVPEDQCTVATAPHWAMPEWLQWIDWGLLLVPETAANRGKMPTKLAEFFASGVRPIFFGCNSDAARWISRAGSAITFDSLEPAALQAVAEAVARSTPEAAMLRAAREATHAHFSLRSGVDRYARLIDGLLGEHRRTGVQPT